MNKILKFELKKSILNIKALIFLVVMLLLKVILAFVNIPQTGKNIDEKLYKKVISEMPGDIHRRREILWKKDWNIFRI